MPENITIESGDFDNIIVSTVGDLLINQASYSYSLLRFINGR
jgi:hypothetical protein